MNKSNIFGLFALLTGIFLVWAGIKNQNPIQVVKNILTGEKAGSNASLSGGNVKSTTTYGGSTGKGTEINPNTPDFSSPFQPVPPSIGPSTSNPLEL